MNRVYRCVWSVSILLGFLGACIALANEITPKGTNSYQLVTGDDADADRTHWNNLYNTTTYVFGKEPAVFLKEHMHLLPLGRVLDIAMGEGRNAVFLAKKGYRVVGVDISEIALAKANRLARDNRVTVKTVNADLNEYQIKPESYEVILNIDYLQRTLVPEIKRGLKRGGIVVFESYTVDQLANPKGNGLNRDFLLKKGELRELFKDYEILIYREENDGKDAKASLIARKP